MPSTPPLWPDTETKRRADEGEEDWARWARCRSAYGERTWMFYGTEDGPEARKEVGRKDRVKRAKALCYTCAVREHCLQFALDHRERFGIWGGMTERERRPLLKEIRRGTTEEEDGHSSGDADQGAGLEDAG